MGLSFARWIALTLGTVTVPIGLTALVFHGHAPGLGDFGQAWQTCGWLPVGVAGAATLLQVACQTARFWIIARQSTAMGLEPAARIFIFSQIANLFLPARAGELGKVVAIAATPRARGTPHVLGAAAIVLADKLVDVGSILLLILVLAPAAQRGVRLPEMTRARVFGAAGLAGLILLAVLRPPIPPRWRARVAGGLSEFGQTLRTLARSQSLVPAIAMAFAAWGAEGAALGTLTKALGYHLSFQSLLTALVLLNLGIAVPLTPAHIGTFEAALAYGLSFSGVTAGHGLAIAVMHHALQVGSIVVPALVIYVVGSARREKGVRGFHATLADKERALDHFRRLAPSYDERVSRGLLAPLRRRERAAVMQQAEFDESARSMIDVGCGAGFYARRAKQAGLYVCAADAVETMVAGLRGVVDAVMVADLETLASTRTYDRVICAGVLDFVALPDLAMKNLASLVAPGGRLVLLVSYRSPGGLLYRLEKLFVGVRVNLFEKGWLIEHAARHGLTLAASSRPLPWNAVLSFVRARLDGGNARDMM